MCRIKNVIFVLAVLSFAASLSAQEQPAYGWEKTIVGNLSFSQSSFSNWSQGGENNWAWQLDLNGKFARIQKKFEWVTRGKISYGRTKISDQASRKSADEIRLESVLLRKGAAVKPYLAVTAETQLTPGYDFSKPPRVKISRFLNPGYFTESIGMEAEPAPDFQTRVGLALKQTVTTEASFALRYSDDPETAPPDVEKVRSEIGAESVTDFSRKLSENILFTTKLELFSNLKAFNQIDVRWDNVFTAKVSKYIGVSFNFKLFYDRDISKSRQIKQVLGVGLSYAFLK